jgi:hypothetical protein
MKRMGMAIMGTGWVSDEYIKAFTKKPASAWWLFAAAIWSGRGTGSGPVRDSKAGPPGCVLDTAVKMPSNPSG